ncbi:zinc-finger family protein [Anoxybacillus sp. B7M1]|uniref:hypothetical protein n=1 Tax=unclassified Anoxybacillus TaxID=2639704 RepID=UPI0005CCD383|nr:MULTISPECIES: hypothetical protein [unclassified Anoxybacillus]ANB57019.1 zinc-finger family protein [Anoxybacillus sp. B2M1]ANB63605.1 zinc-finger family protein [Anoxybacillus sp. B7M1]
MSRYSKEEWQQFISDQLTEAKRIEMEDHLYTCDRCLEIYMELMEEHAASLPSPSRFSISADEIIAQVRQEPHQQQEKVGQKLLHYGIAAAITITLLSSGIFQSIANAAVGASISEKRPSYAEQLMNKTISLLDCIQLSQKEEPHRR